MMSIQQMAEAVDRISMTGTMLDVLGVEHSIGGEIGALDEWDELLRNAHERYKEPSLEKLVKEATKLAKAMDKAVSKWTAFGGGLHVRTDADLEAERSEGMASRQMGAGGDDAAATVDGVEAAGHDVGDPAGPVPGGDEDV